MFSRATGTLFLAAFLAVAAPSLLRAQSCGCEPSCGAEPSCGCEQRTVQTNCCAPQQLIIRVRECNDCCDHDSCCKDDCCKKDNSCGRRRIFGGRDFNVIPPSQPAERQQLENTPIVASYAVGYQTFVPALPLATYVIPVNVAANGYHPYTHLQAQQTAAPAIRQTTGPGLEDRVTALEQDMKQLIGNVETLMKTVDKNSETLRKLLAEEANK